MRRRRKKDDDRKNRNQLLSLLLRIVIVFAVCRSGCSMVHLRFHIGYGVFSRPNSYRGAYKRAFGLLRRERLCVCPEVLVLSFLEAERLAEAPPALPVSSD